MASDREAGQSDQVAKVETESFGTGWSQFLREQQQQTWRFSRDLSSCNKPLSPTLQYAVATMWPIRQSRQKFSVRI